VECVRLGSAWGHGNPHDEEATLQKVERPFNFVRLSSPRHVRPSVSGLHLPTIQTVLFILHCLRGGGADPPEIPSSTARAPSPSGSVDPLVWHHCMSIASMRSQCMYKESKGYHLRSPSNLGQANIFDSPPTPRPMPQNAQNSLLFPFRICDTVVQCLVHLFHAVLIQTTQSTACCSTTGETGMRPGSHQACCSPKCHSRPGLSARCVFACLILRSCCYGRRTGWDV
jgi:hypothetical protein